MLHGMPASKQDRGVTRLRQTGDKRREGSDLHLHFLPFAYRMKYDSRSALAAEVPIRPPSRSTFSAPHIDHQLLGDERDLQAVGEKGADMIRSGR
ncbi:MAG: hypothetical protein QOF76_3300 [Solirubrobacteraceae bacterium]|nr:hypothetical protein [Solirubrobacteraceae bacterium]